MEPAPLWISISCEGGPLSVGLLPRQGHPESLVLTVRKGGDCDISTSGAELSEMAEVLGEFRNRVSKKASVGGPGVRDYRILAFKAGGGLVFALIGNAISLLAWDTEEGGLRVNGLSIGDLESIIQFFASVRGELS